jgi:hypothetical protein
MNYCKNYEVFWLRLWTFVIDSLFEGHMFIIAFILVYFVKVSMITVMGKFLFLNDL